VKIFEGKEWIWCAHHRCWCKYLTDDCEMHKKLVKQDNTDSIAALADLGIDNIEKEQE